MRYDTAPQYNALRERGENTVGLRIAEARSARNWSLAQLTAMLQNSGVKLTKAAVNKWETGETVPNVYQFLAVAALLGMDERLGAYRADCPPELNPEGLRKLAEYRQDLISSGNYRPEPKPLKPAVPLREMAVACMPAAAGTGNWLDDTEAYDSMSFPADEIPKGAELGIRISRRADRLGSEVLGAECRRGGHLPLRRPGLHQDLRRPEARRGPARALHRQLRRDAPAAGAALLQLRPVLPHRHLPLQPLPDLRPGAAGLRGGKGASGMIETMARVKELAAERGLTLYQLSLLCKVSYHTLKSTEERNGQLKLETIDKICTGLRMPLRDFFL